MKKIGDILGHILADLLFLCIGSIMTACTVKIIFWIIEL